MTDTTDCPECQGPKIPARAVPLRRGKAPAFDQLCGECAKSRLNGHTFVEAVSLVRRTIEAMPEDVRPGFQAIFDQARLFALDGRSLAMTLAPIDLRQPRGLGRCFILAIIHSGESVAYAERGNALAAQSSLLKAWNFTGTARGLMLASSSISEELQNGLSRILRQIANPARARRLEKISHSATLVRLLTAAAQDFAADQVPLIDRVARAAEICKSEGRSERDWASRIAKHCGCTPTHVRRLLRQLNARQGQPTAGQC